MLPLWNPVRPKEKRGGPSGAPGSCPSFVLAAVSGASLARDTNSTATPSCRNVVRHGPQGYARPSGPGSLVSLLWIGFDSVSPAARQRSAWLTNACSTVVAAAALATVLSARQRGAGRRLRKSASTTNWSGQQGDLAFIHYR